MHPLEDWLSGKKAHYYDCVSIDVNTLLLHTNQFKLLHLISSRIGSTNKLPTHVQMKIFLLSDAGVTTCVDSVIPCGSVLGELTLYSWWIAYTKQLYAVAPKQKSNSLISRPPPFLFFGLCSVWYMEVTMYYTESKLKNKKWGRPGNKNHVNTIATPF